MFLAICKINLGTNMALILKQQQINISSKATRKSSTVFARSNNDYINLNYVAKLYVKEGNP